MKTIIKSALIIDPRSTHRGKKRDILIENNIITKIAAKIEEKKAAIISEKNLCVSPGWIDLRANFRDPGDEYKEDLNSGLNAAKAGGFKTVLIMPSTNPPLDTKAQIEYVQRKATGHTVELLTTGTLSSGLEGKQLSEMFDMKQSGAVAFTDDKENVGTELMVRALDYSRNFDGLIISFPMDKGVNPGGMLHEGPTSVSIGLKGLSSASEEIRLSRDIELLRYCGGRLHVSLISTAGSVELIKKAKKDGLNITASIASHQLAFTDADMSTFDSNLKVLPPFRGESDRKALIKGLKDGVIDAICSDHSPEDHEHKVLEFEYANYGISSIQTSFAVAYEALKNTLSLEEIISKFTSGPAHVLKRELPAIKEGNSAALTVFATETEQTFGKKEWKSKSINSPFFNTKFNVRVVDVI